MYRGICRRHRRNTTSIGRGGGRFRVQTPLAHMTARARYTSSNQTSACSSGTLAFTVHPSYYIIIIIILLFFNIPTATLLILSFSLRLHINSIIITLLFFFFFLHLYPTICDAYTVTATVVNFLT
jgi:hypothetical protein